MDTVTLDLVFTIFGSTGLIGASALALCLLPRNDAEVAQLCRSIGWGAEKKRKKKE